MCSKCAKAPQIAPVFMELPTKKIASKKLVKALVCLPVSTTHLWPPLLPPPWPLLWALLCFLLLACLRSPLRSLLMPCLRPPLRPLLCSLLLAPLPVRFFWACVFLGFGLTCLFSGVPFPPWELLCPWVSCSQWARFPLGLSPL
ncbi:hypothetical protein DSO57_1024602 [Entomophthora muscae]|uniref:Uncharacterized protein n=1 Tax=Entomophthora muscae TaxID=34485 RepID=A0ACC2TPC8_9FUNG|nr:hypothetical protein DSO57_1024602 [Entomophthora muscae]